jgi:ubiquinone/menaquinone biosynthesis C-methylase UbiE
MPAKVDLYDSAYAHYGSDVYRQVRLETYGEDFGQTSWMTSEESNEIPRLLELRPGSAALEVGCGSGGYAVHLAEKVGCRVVGLDVNAPGVHAANQLTAAKGLEARAQFQRCDASQPLPFDAATFDAAFSNDVFCHLPNRLEVLCELLRILKPGGRALFSDALIIGGMLSNEEIATRSSIGFYVYSPPGENERLLEQAGFRNIRAIDTTEHAAHIAQRWHQAREKRRNELLGVESTRNFEGLQRFLSCVHRLTAERRLLRYLYVADKAVDS